MIYKYTLSKGNDKSFAHSQNHIRKTSAERNIDPCLVGKLQGIIDYWNGHNLEQIRLRLIGERGKVVSKLSNYLFVMIAYTSLFE